MDVILAGPLPVLNSLQPEDVHVRVDLSNLAPGTYQLIPDVVVAEQGVSVQSILPGTVEVTISKETAVHAYSRLLSRRHHHHAVSHANPITLFVFEKKDSDLYA